MPRFATEEAAREWAQDKAGDHSPEPATACVCAYCEACEVARQGEYCSPECEFQDAIRDEDNANDYAEAP